MTQEEANELTMEAVEEASMNGKPLLYRLQDPDKYQRTELSGTLYLVEQEYGEDDYVHIVKYTDIMQLITIGFGTVFGDEAVTIAFVAYDMIIDKYGENAAWMQIFEYEFPDGDKVRFYIINDEEHWTVLMPEER